MTDWIKSTGRTGSIMIRDTGTKVEFWLKAAADTYNYYGIPWRAKVNGTITARKTVFPTGGNWTLCGSFNVTTDQTVTFYMGKSGTTGLGGPTYFAHRIIRTTVPGVPFVHLNGTTDTTMTVDADTKGDGGARIDQIQLGYGTSSSGATSFANLSLVNGYGKITGLVRGTTYYVWVRAHNTIGWSHWSTPRSVRTKSGPSAMATPLVTNVTQSAVYFKLSPNFDGGSPALGYRIGYGTSSGGPTDYIDWNIALTRGVYNLQPGKTYYFWAQANNAYGASAWSGRTQATVLAGAVITVGSTKKRAVPYIRQSGVWKLAQPWVKHGGVWKKTW